MLLAICLVYQQFRRAGIRGGLVATVHDELLAEVQRDDVEIASEIMDREMRRAFEISFPEAPTTGLLKVIRGRNWQEAREDPATGTENSDTLATSISNTQTEGTSICA
jgi:DNA polymerase I-like protein with 3'-5' exonuclease and polymerase domains